LYSSQLQKWQNWSLKRSLSITAIDFQPGEDTGKRVCFGLAGASSFNKRVLTMGESQIFGKLASELSLEERKILLEKLNSNSTLPQEPLYEDENNASSGQDGQNDYSRLPWYSRLFFLLMGLFHGASPLRLFENHQLARIGQWIKANAPGIYDHPRDLLLPEMYKKLLALKEAARFFYNVLDRSINRDRGSFYAFLGSLEMEDIHRRINDGTDPELLISQKPETPDTELRQIAQNNLMKSLSLISDVQKNAMYANARSLHCLKALSAFLFDRLILNFSVNPAAQGPVCIAGIVKDQLTVLQNILFSLKYIPSMALLESLFVFTLQDRSEGKEADITEEMRRLLALAEKSLGTVHDFNRRVPLTQILRCTSRNLTLSVQDISGGEEWFLVYRDYWKRYVDERFTHCVQSRRQQDLTESFDQFFRGAGLKKLSHVFSNSDSSGFPVNGSLCLSFLLTFSTMLFTEEINLFLSPILLNGNFFSREDRTLFTESYNELMKLGDAIRYFEMRIAPMGDLGKRYATVKADTTISSLRRHKIQAVIDEANGEIFKIIGNSRTALEGMISILRRIIQNICDGKSSVLSNITQFVGKGNLYTTGLNDSMTQLQKALKLLNDVQVFELGK
jgi:hypothetical protein